MHISRQIPILQFIPELFIWFEVPKLENVHIWRHAINYDMVSTNILYVKTTL